MNRGTRGICIAFGCIAFGFGAGTGLLSGCAPTAFDSVSPLTARVVGMTWSEPVPIEPRPSVPDLDEPRTVAGFEVLSSGEAIHVGGAFYDSFSGLFEGRILSWTPVDGWSGSGERTRAIASDEGFEWVSGGAGPDGTAIFAFQHEDGATDPIVTTYYHDGAWGEARAATTTNLPAFPAFSESSGLHPRNTIAFDPLGRALFGSVDGAGAGQVLLWEDPQVFGIGDAWDSIAAVDAPGAHPSRATIVSDGVAGSCLLYEPGDDDSRALAAHCLDFSGTETLLSENLIDGSVRGHAAASDGNGLILVVAQYSVSTGAFSLLGFTIDEGEPSESASTVSIGMPTGVRTAPVFENGTYEFEALPELVHLGSGKFMAAWIGVNPSESAGLSSQVFAKTYSVSSGEWSPLMEVTAAEPFVERPRHRSLSLFTNGKGDAGIAINHVKSEADDAVDDVHDLIVRRYNRQEGWLGTFQTGSGCTGSLRECTRRPRGALLDSGEAAVLFFDLDENGFHRLKATTFSAE